MSAPQNISAQRAEWLSRLCADREVTLVPLRVAVIIANHVNAHLGEAWPSQGTIAAKLGMKKYNVTKAVRDLVTLDYLIVIKKGQANRYRLRFPGVPGNTGGDVQTDTSSEVSPHTTGVSLGAPDGCSAGHPIYEENGVNSEGAAPEGASAPVADESLRSLEHIAVAGAPGGALLPARLIGAIAEAFGREPMAHETDRFVKLLGTIGRTEFQDRLASYCEGVEAGTIERVPIARWLRRAGLMEVRRVA